MICLEKIRVADPVWQCDQCFSLLHLICVKTWIKKKEQSLKARSVLSPELFRDLATPNWECPKCRKEYACGEAPNDYFCFCGKCLNPRVDAWLTPHSCGERCDKNLPSCNHKCTLLCHPGPCPPCPQIVETACYCGKLLDTRRCGLLEFSCDSICNKQLHCGKHRCRAKCHAGPCPRCSQRVLRSCACGKEKQERPCAESVFHCRNPCSKPMSCGNHFCQKVCHAGPCGECPWSGARTCYCGKLHLNISCTEEVRSCGDTCEKLLSCGIHRCMDRCHKGPCPKCRQLVNKRCPCKQSRKQVQCWQDYVCDRKCTRKRNCLRHQCKKKCCTGNCPPCPEVCGRRLTCGNHKCEMACHDGECYPCPRTVRIECFCKTTVIEVPCGAESKTPRPKCNQPCAIPATCHHSNREPHLCHFGPCPPCRQICGVQSSHCQHSCPLPCHDPIPDPLPLTKREKRLGIRPTYPPPIAFDQVRCPPCPYLVTRSCLGRHEIREVKCSTPKKFQCDRQCGNPLECGNHQCNKPCHEVTIDRRQPDWKDHSKGVCDSCSKCELPCHKDLVPKCGHQCPLSCHPGSCPPCKELIKTTCWCPSSVVRVFYCHQRHDSLEYETLRSCSQRCNRSLANCSHRCSKTCHSGDCESSLFCRKKLVVKCQCGRRKEEWVCIAAQKYRAANRLPKNNSKLLACDSACLEKRHLGKQRTKEKLEDSKQPSKATAPPKRRQISKQKNVKNRQAQSPHPFWAIRLSKSKHVTMLFMGVLGFAILFVTALILMLQSLQ